MADNRPFIKLYVDGMPKLLKASPAMFRVLIALSLHLDLDNTVDLSPRKRKMILQMLSISKQTLSNSLVELQHAGLINKLGTGFYAVDSMFIKRCDVI